AEDGIRDFHVTGVQTCALPIYLSKLISIIHSPFGENLFTKANIYKPTFLSPLYYILTGDAIVGFRLKKEELSTKFTTYPQVYVRSEERRVGKECRSEVTPDD